MKTIAFALQKGGVGKTSLAVALAGELAREAGATLIIDLDPQGNTSGWLHPEVDAEAADMLIDLYNGNTPDLQRSIVKTGFPGLSILPTKGLDGALRLFADTMAINKPLLVRSLVRNSAAIGYAYCILDLSPYFGPLEKTALLASDETITPATADVFGADGLLIFAENLKRLRQDYETTRPAYKRIIINALDRRIPQHEKSLAEIQSAAAGLTVYTIPTDPVFRKAQSAGRAIQAITGAKAETKRELHRLAVDIIAEHNAL
jgi:chromosome partitioning protein